MLPGSGVVFLVDAQELFADSESERSFLGGMEKCVLHSLVAAHQTSALTDSSVYLGARTLLFPPKVGLV